MTCTIGSLFSGACDGIALGLEMVGLGPVLWHAESDQWRRKVLARHWPLALAYDDVRAVVRPNAVDIVCGGFPCVGFSSAGKRRGMDDERSALWSEFARVLGDLRPALAFVENAAAATVRGWLRVVGDLAELGFDAEWTTLRGADVGLPIERERVFLLACAGEVGRAKLREAHDLDRGNALWHIAHRRGAISPPPGPGSWTALQAWIADHGGIEPGLRRDTPGLPHRVDRVAALGDSASPLFVAEAWRRLAPRLIAA